MGIQIKNGSCDSDHARFRGDLSSIGFNAVYPCAKFDNSSFSLPEILLGDPKIKNGSHNYDDIPVKGDFSSICYDLTLTTCAQNMTTV